MTQVDTTSAPAAGSTRSPLFAALTGVTALGVLLQAISAGAFMALRHSGAGWTDVHDIVADVTLVAALATAIVGLAVKRRAQPAVAWGAVVLFVLLVAQVVIGHLITDADLDGLVAVHVPLALIVFGLTVWLSIRASTRGRSAERTPQQP
ncbi:MAG TPA: hypothetical protein VN759_07970 [Pseudolysinimonas sp.]|nr:hypothetical protein [Pseudolysinimonas sp.]